MKREGGKKLENGEGSRVKKTATGTSWLRGSQQGNGGHISIVIEDGGRWTAELKKKSTTIVGQEKKRVSRIE